jgi:hypothetical protein
MPRVALPDSLQSCRISGCHYTPYVKDQCCFTGFIDDRFQPLQKTTSRDIPFKILLGIIGY